jgi:hypothetical protein
MLQNANVIQYREIQLKNGDTDELFAVLCKCFPQIRIATVVCRRCSRFVLRPIFTAYVLRTSRALDVRGTRVIRPFDACTQQSDTWIPTEVFTKRARHVRTTYVWSVA